MGQRTPKARYLYASTRSGNLVGNGNLRRVERDPKIKVGCLGTLWCSQSAAFFVPPCSFEGFLECWFLLVLVLVLASFCFSSFVIVSS